ncbi:DUF6994 family protein [Nocardioides silvaticus]|uniref:DUF6994 family protein n=1 Tax=Nocardioides silvaticus TaxID=2201891 RepID=UPI000D6D106A|nr:hypothetical protein [Nocardioides silvaticus]
MDDDDIDVGFNFRDDPDYRGDADRDSRKLKRWHQRLWNKALPDGRVVECVVDPATGGLVHGGVPVSSDTIATTHSRYSGAKSLWAEFAEEEQEAYERSIYTVSAFIIFPVRPQSLNQRRGTTWAISDRFDLTLECIRQHYLGMTGSPLADVLAVDAHYFRLFGEGLTGFITYVEFFHLQDLVADGTIRWFDEFDGNAWDFTSPPLPQSEASYRRYLSNVAAFVAARGERIDAWRKAA